MQMRKGISLIVLVITIIVMIILAGSIVITLNNSGIIGKANEAVDKTDLAAIQNIAALKWAEKYLDSNKKATKGELRYAVEEGLKAEGIDITPYAIDVTENGVSVTIKQSVDVLGEEITGSDGQFKYVKLSNGQIQLTRYMGNAVELNFPSKYDDYIVYSIGNIDARKEKDFRYNVLGSENSTTNKTKVRSITISEGIKKIEMAAFSGCSNLTGNIVFPSTLKEIGAYSFNGCSGLTGNLHIPDGVNVIGRTAFQNCSGFKGNLKLPSDLKEISPYIFYGCSSLTGDLLLPKGITAIGDYSFNNCSGLTGNLTIPEGVVTIGTAAFQNCSGLNKYLTLPDTLTVIGAFAFNKCKGLIGDIIIPEGVVSVERYAFQSCTGFNGILKLPSTLEVIADGAFNHCARMTNTTLTIPKTVKRIGINENDATHVFHDFAVGTIKEYIVETGNEKFKSENGVMYSKDGRRLVAYPAARKDSSYEILEGVTIIDELAFSYAGKLKKVIIPNSYVLTTTIPENYLNTGNNLAVGLYVRSGIADIEVKADNPNYKSENGVIYSKDGTTLWYVAARKADAVVIPEGVTTIKSGAFFGWDVGKFTIHVAASVTNIEERPLAVLNEIPDRVTFAEGCIYGFLEDGTIGKLS